MQHVIQHRTLASKAQRPASAPRVDGEERSSAKLERCPIVVGYLLYDRPSGVWCSSESPRNRLS